MARPVVAIVQSSYIPWKGYFDLIAASDSFVLFDDVQFTKRDWRNRNRIKTADGPAWLTIPVRTKGRFDQKIDEVEISDPAWAERHWRSIAFSYVRAPFFKDYADGLERLYEKSAGLSRLSEVNRCFLNGLCAILGVEAHFVDARALSASGAKTDRLLDICQKTSARSYLSGPSARAYLDPNKFQAADIDLHYISYDGYPVYKQLHGAFDPHVSVLDLIFMQGPSARNHLVYAGAT